MKDKFKFNREAFSARAKDLRLKHRLTQQQITDYLGVTRAAYGGCESEKGYFRPSVDILLGLREFYTKAIKELYPKSTPEKAISMDWLFGFVDNQYGMTLIEDHSKSMKDKQAEINSLKEKNEILNQHNLLLKETNEAQKNLIELLKKK
jgi:transcriptional regulator with XRE-family HTH domain